ncbi:inositol hexakisphosphate and diphosphoinositol-pentakisphosphate kinase [Coemansia javaensis]|uniref:Inositol hexakisphosphate and diphosphoinositol-pentakisphosphate kinase n=1 Tax=Coemansia javaensis TaxID=2761396 RepID=A0A9W8H0Q9_9FUNG|nr:inositol hexakisphosphate and diphosphoinositol-pentakisphosphate kinase [Coemansia javaensis]
MDGAQFMDPAPVIGVCAMDSKARSKPMGSVLERLRGLGRYEVVYFGEKTILDEAAAAWPKCDILIAFFSRGFPLGKAVEYARLRRPFSVNALEQQYLLLDRRVVLAVLGQAGVPTPAHVVVSRDGGPQVPAAARQAAGAEVLAALRAGAVTDEAQVVEEDDGDTLRVGGRVIRKPFVEKPADAEDHNIHIYYARAQGGGVRRLFRKVGNRSSEFVAGPARVRRQGSFVYEEFVEVDGAVDVKVYTVGEAFAHAETRKSPVVDGHVRRTSDGKEMRFATALTAAEREYARRVARAFGQRVCGFDILRAGGRSLVMDVNGWSFVKGSEAYYERAARILHERFQDVERRRWLARFAGPDAGGDAAPASAPRGGRWALKAVLDVCRHADRTPKQKTKRVLRSAAIVGLLGPGAAGATMRGEPELRRVLDALARARRDPHPADAAHDLARLHDVLRRKIAQPGTKAQARPAPDAPGAAVLILKWGGECTHAGVAQAQDLGRRMRTDLLLINAALLGDVRFAASAERRVQSTVAAYAGALLGPGAAPHVTVRADMLDDSPPAAKRGMDAAKQRLRALFNHAGAGAGANPHARGLRLPREMAAQPREFLRGLCAVVARLVARMDANFAALDAAALHALQPDWCCGETADLFRERWHKILRDLRTADHQYDPAKAGELYDSIKYDALHNRRFLARIFMPTDQLPPHHQEPDDDETETGAAAAAAAATYPPDPLLAQEDVRALYYRAKLLFDFVSRYEYGADAAQRRRIGIQVSAPLLRQLVHDLCEARDAPAARTRFYFTKESHVHTLLNLVRLMPGAPGGGDDDDDDDDSVGELDYLTHIIFEVYERTPDDDDDNDNDNDNNNDNDGGGGGGSAGPAAPREHSVRVGFSPGAHCLHILDTDVDATHALKVLPRRSFTSHMPLASVVAMLQGLLADECLDHHHQPQ